MAKATIKEIGRAVRKLRKNKKRPKLPKAVWLEIRRLKTRHSIAEIAKATGISERYLRRRLPESPEFFELKQAVVPSVTSVVEVRRADGVSMTVRVGSTSELRTVLGAFVGQ